MEAKKKRGRKRREPLCVYRGTRYAFYSLGTGWVVVDLRPTDEGFVFQKGRRRKYAVKILESTEVREEAVFLRKRAQELEGLWKASKSKESEAVIVDRS